VGEQKKIDQETRLKTRGQGRGVNASISADLEKASDTFHLLFVLSCEGEDEKRRGKTKVR